MNAVFLDTSGLLAIWDEDDQWHIPATAAFAHVAAARARVFTTTYVLAECGNAVARTDFRQSVVDLRIELETRHTLIVPAVEDWQEAWTRYEAGYPGAPGIVDELSFVIMRRLGLHRAFTNDRHFHAAGFEVLF